MVSVLWAAFGGCQHIRCRKEKWPRRARDSGRGQGEGRGDRARGAAPRSSSSRLVRLVQARMGGGRSCQVCLTQAFAERVMLMCECRALLHGIPDKACRAPCCILVLDRGLTHDEGILQARTSDRAKGGASPTQSAATGRTGKGYKTSSPPRARTRTSPGSWRTTPGCCGAARPCWARR